MGLTSDLMGYTIFPDLKDEDVLCQKRCAHIDCEAYRSMNKICIVCNEEIKAGDRVYGWDKTLRHARCAEFGNIWFKKKTK